MHDCSASDFPPGVLLAKTLNDALAMSSAASPAVETVFVIGGAQPFADALSHPSCDTAYVTHVRSEFDCDVSLPPLSTFGFEQLAAQVINCARCACFLLHMFFNLDIWYICFVLCSRMSPKRISATAWLYTQRLRAWPRLC